MGVNLKDLLVKREISLDELAGKVLAFDAYNTLFQFLSSIRGPDGQLLTNNVGQVTSHLIGLFSRLAKLIESGVKPVFVFDGTHPELKRVEVARRIEIKKQAQAKFEEALSVGDAESMRKYAARTTKITQEIESSAKLLLHLMGVPVIDAPSEGEAQAAHIVKSSQAWAVASQDYDSLLYATPLLVRNLSIVGKRRQPGMRKMITIKPELVDLEATLAHLHITQEQLIYLGMIVGTDYNQGGIRGLGPKKALKVVKEFPDPAQLFAEVKWDEHCDVHWQDVLKCFTQLPVRDVHVTFSAADPSKLREFLVDQNNFSVDRVESTIEKIIKYTRSKEQKSLDQFFS